MRKASHFDVYYRIRVGLQNLAKTKRENKNKTPNEQPKIMGCPVKF